MAREVRGGISPVAKYSIYIVIIVWAFSPTRIASAEDDHDAQDDAGRIAEDIRALVERPQVADQLLAKALAGARNFINTTPELSKSMDTFIKAAEDLFQNPEKLAESAKALVDSLNSDGVVEALRKDGTLKSDADVAREIAKRLKIDLTAANQPDSVEAKQLKGISDALKLLPSPSPTPTPQPSLSPTTAGSLPAPIAKTGDPQTDKIPDLISGPLQGGNSPDLTGGPIQNPGTSPTTTPPGGGLPTEVPNTGFNGGGNLQVPPEQVPTLDPNVVGDPNDLDDTDNTDDGRGNGNNGQGEGNGNNRGLGNGNGNNGNQGQQQPPITPPSGGGDSGGRSNAQTPQAPQVPDGKLSIADPSSLFQGTQVSDVSLGSLTSAVGPRPPDDSWSKGPDKIADSISQMATNQAQTFMGMAASFASSLRPAGSGNGLPSLTSTSMSSQVGAMAPPAEESRGYTGAMRSATAIGMAAGAQPSGSWGPAMSGAWSGPGSAESSRAMVGRPSSGLRPGLLPSGRGR